MKESFIKIIKSFEPFKPGVLVRDIKVNENNNNFQFLQDVYEEYKDDKKYNEALYIVVFNACYIKIISNLKSIGFSLNQEDIIDKTNNATLVSIKDLKNKLNSGEKINFLFNFINFRVKNVLFYESSQTKFENNIVFEDLLSNNIGE